MSQTKATYILMDPENYKLADILGEKHTVSLTTNEKNIVMPHVYGITIGEYTEKYGKDSYFIKDKKSTALLDKVLATGKVKTIVSDVLRENNAGGYDHLKLTKYMVMYKREDATFDKPTCDDCIMNYANATTTAEIEVKLAYEEMIRYVNFTVKTGGSFACTFMDYVEQVEDIFTEAVETNTNGFRNTDNLPEAYFFAPDGTGSWICFESTRELMRTVVSIRLVNVNLEVTNDY